MIARLVGISVMVLASGLSTAVQAHDLGTVSKTYPITEPDIRAVIIGQLASKDMNKIGRHMANDTRAYTHNLTALDLPPVDTTTTHYIDPSIRIKKDLYLPRRTKDGRLTWSLSAPAGTRVNMLKHVRPVTAFLVVNPESPKQRRFAVDAYKAAPRYIKILASAGDPAKLAKQIDTSVYRASEWMIRYFGVNHAPALIRPGYGSHSTDIAVTALGRPWTVNALRHVDPLKALSRIQAEAWSAGAGDSQ